MRLEESDRYLGTINQQNNDTIVVFPGAAAIGLKQFKRQIVDTFSYEEMEEIKTISAEEGVKKYTNKYGHRFNHITK